VNTPKSVSNQKGPTMTTRKQNTDKSEKTEGRVKVDRLRLKKETIKDLSAAEKNRIKGGAAGATGVTSLKPTCILETIATCVFCR